MDHSVNLMLVLMVSSIFMQSISSEQPLILSLTVKKTSSFSNPKPTNKVAFHHNVTLTVSLSVGSPPQQVSMVLDAGSELSWLHCKKTPTTPLSFNPLVSSSYAATPCSSATCRNKTRDFPIPVSCDPKKLCHATLSYADGSFFEGNLAAEIFHINNLNLRGIVFGCMGVSSSSNPEDFKTSGLIGMNRGPLSFVNQMGYPKFSYCISGHNSNGVLLFGDANFPWLTTRKYTPLVQMSIPLPSFDRLAYTVKLKGIKVGGRVLPLPESVLVPDHTGAGQTMIDSGTQFTYLVGPAYKALKDEYIKQTKGVLRTLNDPHFVFQGAMDLCYLVQSTRKTLPPLPSVTLMFPGVEMSVTAEKLLYNAGVTRGKDQVYCLTIGNSDLLGISAYIIGNHHQQNFWMEFDLANSRFGLAEVNCELASKKLGLGL